jgi:PPK2 family polyphosphate:nucleotide phosphotransferase
MSKGIVKVEPGKKISLSTINTDIPNKAKDKVSARKQMEKMDEELLALQECLYAEHKQSLLVIFQAMDTGGKDGAIQVIFAGANPEGVKVTSFKAPSSDELSHDFLWRVHNAVPPKGLIGVWNRSHYEDVLIVRVHESIDKKTCEKRYEDINAFEKILSNNGVKILKFFLHISKDEQKRRLQSRLDNPSKHWKFDPADLAERELWDKYQQAYENAINACSTKWAPWYIVPSDYKWHRNIVITQKIIETLEQMKPSFPKIDFDPSKVVIK